MSLNARWCGVVVGVLLLLGAAVLLRHAAADPKKTLATVEALKKGQLSPPPPTSSPTSDAGLQAQVKGNLDQLAEQDRKLAAEQKFCPITEERLGDPEMGVPIKIMVKDQPVFLCCKGCKSSALKNPDKTLARVEELKEKVKKEGVK